MHKLAKQQKTQKRTNKAKVAKVQKRKMTTKKVARKSTFTAAPQQKQQPQQLTAFVPKATFSPFAFKTRAFSTTTDAVSIEPDVSTVIPPRRPTILNHSLVMMCSGPDDKDVLPLISQTITKLNGSLEESRMTCLGADFTVSALLTIPMTVKPDILEKELIQALPDFTVACRLTSPAPSSANYEAAKILALDIEGPDQPKIVSTFTQILYKHNVSVKDVITDTSSAPFLGYNVFAMKAVVSIPLKTDMKRLEQELQAFESQFGVNLAVSDPADQQQQPGGEQKM